MQRQLRYSWIIRQRLAVGERPPSLACLADLGFSGALSLQEAEEPGPQDQPPPDFRFHRVPIQDGLIGGVPSSAQLEQAVAALAGLLAEGRQTYVYCYAGVGRSPLVCMAYLASSRKLSLIECYRQVSDAHLPTEPTAGQLKALALFLGGETQDIGD
jgi:dual specificity protein phosphatase-like protein